MKQRCEETTIGDIENCKALIADLEALAVKAEQIALASGDEMNGTADYIQGRAEQSLEMARWTLRLLERDSRSDDIRDAIERRTAEQKVA